MKTNTLPLSGIKIVDFSRLLPGPWATQMLAELGAIVYKVEEPDIGDPSRHSYPRYKENSVYFHATNGSKKSITVDLREPSGKEVAQRLIANCDVVVESFRPGLMAKLGLDYAVAKAINPAVIYCSISGFGKTGSLSHIAGHDLVIQSMTGLLGCSPDGQATVPGMQSADFAGSLYCVIAIQAALAQRAKTGIGCDIDISMYESLLNMCLIPLSTPFAKSAGYSGEPRMESFGGNPRYSIYKSKDGRNIAITLLEFKIWKEFCLKIDRPDLIFQDETPADRLSTHGERGIVYRQALQKYFSLFTWNEIMEHMLKTGIAIAPVCSPQEAMDLEHVKERGAIDWLDHPIEGKIPYLVNPLVRSGLAIESHQPAPLLGENSEEILQNIGYSAEEIKGLMNK
jgi:crotonobetainyl-CoA:carnitine CoA-transferase CaiB-like acyl-CoA transferase